MRRVLATGGIWGLIWSIAILILLAVIGVVDPDSIDPGEGPLMALFIFSPMGFFSGVVFALLNRRAAEHASLARTASLGFLGSVLVQIPYLGHGDAGLVANTQLALVFAGFGACAALLWRVIARRMHHAPAVR